MAQHLQATFRSIENRARPRGGVNTGIGGFIDGGRVTDRLPVRVGGTRTATLQLDRRYTIYSASATPSRSPVR